MPEEHTLPKQMCHSKCGNEVIRIAALLSLSAGAVLRMAAVAELSAVPVQGRIVLRQLLVHLLELAIEPPEGRALLLLLFVLYALLQASKEAAHEIDIIDFLSERMHWLQDLAADCMHMPFKVVRDALLTQPNTHMSMK